MREIGIMLTGHLIYKVHIIFDNLIIVSGCKQLWLERMLLCLVE